MSRQEGFSLVELSFVLVIMMILAGITSAGGQYLSNQAKAQQMTELAKEFFTAINRYHSKNGVLPSTLAAQLGPHLDTSLTGAAILQFKDPWTGATKSLTTRNPVPAAGDYGNAAALGDPDAERLIYMYNASLSTTQTFDVYDQDHGAGNALKFRYFAVQALDYKGNAVVTYGK